MALSVVPRLLVAAIGFVSALAESTQRAAPGLVAKEGRRLTAISMQAALAPTGFKLDAVHKLGIDASGNLEHLRHLVAGIGGRAGSGRRLYSGTNRRDFVRLLMNLNSLAYKTTDEEGSGGGLCFGESSMQPIYDAGDSLFGPNVTTHDDEVKITRGWIDRLDAELANASVIDDGSGQDTQAYDSTGVHALEFSAPAVGKVLVFRGTYSTGDYRQMMGWITEWMLEKNTAMMRHQWMDLSGLPWTDKVDSQESTLSNTKGAALYLAGNFFHGVFRGHVADLATDAGLDPEKVSQTGYWEFTKAIADSVRSSLEPDQNLTITGHSQGGGRAALVSMYYEKKYNETYDTVTLAAVGGQCWSRVSHLDDVDPFVSHPQVTDYVHPLDIYGHFDYDIGNVCLYKRRNVSTSRARKYCEDVFGYQAQNLHTSSSPTTKELNQQFSRCKYFTHGWQSLEVYLNDDTVLLEDGTTDGGCTIEDPIPQGDTRCPHNADLTKDGCHDEVSCKGCSVATSYAGFGCVWCESAKACRSRALSWFHTCEITNDTNSTGWVDYPDGQCHGQSGAALTAASTVFGVLLLNMLW